MVGVVLQDNREEKATDEKVLHLFYPIAIFPCFIFFL